MAANVTRIATPTRAILWLSCFALQACQETLPVAPPIAPQVANLEKAISMTPQALLAGPLDAMDVQRMPAIVPVTTEQSAYVVRLVDSLLGVVSGSRSLEDEERLLLGAGEFFVPKDRTKPHRVVRLYAQANFLMKFVSASITRPQEDAAWSAATLTVQPKNAPLGLYQLGLPHSVFAKLRRTSAVTEDRAANGKAPAHRVNVFNYVHQAGATQVQVTLECRLDLCELNAPHPSSFHMLKIIRL
jgi:hypothetical protein